MSKLELKQIVSSLVNVLLVFGLIHLLIFGFKFETSVNGAIRNGVMSEATQKFMLWPITSILFVSSCLDKITRRKAYFIFLFYIVSGIGFGSRNVIVSAIPIITYLLFSFKNSHVLIVSSIVLLLLAFYSGSLNFIIYRLSNTEVSGDLPRILEFMDFWNSHSLYHHILGKGFGGENNYWIFSEINGGVNNMHIGSGYILLKGGFVLLFIVIGHLLNFIRGNRDNLMAVVLFVVFIFINELSHTLLVRLPYVLTVILISQTLSISKKNSFASNSTHY